MLRHTLSIATVVALAFPASLTLGQDSNRILGSGMETSSVSSSSGSVPIVKAATPINPFSIQDEQPAVESPVVESPVVESPVVESPEVQPSPVVPQSTTVYDMSSYDVASEDSAGGLKLGGWVQAGYHSQSTGLFNNVPDRINAHQVWLYAEKAAAREAYWDWGFRLDTMYGTDASKTQAFGNNPGTWDFQNGLDNSSYGFALPQAYAEVAKDNVSIKVGHFFTAVGYEVVTAPDNFFYSHAYTMFNSEPFTHTGALATIDANDTTTVYAGWTLGWDTGFNQFNGGSSFLGGFSKTLGEDATFTYITTAGNLGWRGSGYSHSMVLDMTLTDRLNYIVQSDLLSTDSSGGNNNEVGLNQYLIYQVSEKVAAGTRIEWWKSDIGGTAQSTYSMTSGLNLRRSENIMIRPEVRYNWGADLVGAAQETPIFGVDVIFTF